MRSNIRDLTVLYTGTYVDNWRLGVVISIPYYTSSTPTVMLLVHPLYYVSSTSIVALLAVLRTPYLALLAVHLTSIYCTRTLASHCWG